MVMTRSSPATLDATVHARWGEAANAGYQPVPNLLLKHQRQLDLTAVDLVVLLNLLSYWWYAENLPFPKSATIARRIGLTQRTVQRSLKTMESRGLLRRVESGTTESRVCFDPKGLVQRLIPLARKEPGYRSRNPLPARSMDRLGDQDHADDAGGRSRPGRPGPGAGMDRVLILLS